MMGPRIRGKVGQAFEPEEMKGKWFFTLWVTAFGAGEPTDKDSLGQFGPWDTEEIAHKELRHAAQLASEAITERIDGKPSGEYIDMKTNVRRKWDRSNELKVQATDNQNRPVRDMIQSQAKAYLAKEVGHG